MVSLGEVQFFVAQQRFAARESLHFDQGAPDGAGGATLCETRLAAVIDASPETRRNVGNLASWGSLGRGRAAADLLLANDEIVYVGIQLMADHCEVLDLGLSSATPFCVVSPHAVEAALAKYDRDGRPTSAFVPPESPRGLSLYDLARALAPPAPSAPPPPPDAAPLECVTFVLHWAHHWSLLVYDTVRRKLIYHDSFGEHSRERASTLAALLRAASIVPRECALEPVAFGVQQSGYWQCGYAAIAFAAYVAGKLDGGALVRTVSDDAELARFVAVMRARSSINRGASRFVAQNTHWYRAAAAAVASDDAPKGNERE